MTATQRGTRVWLWLISHTLNRLTTSLARSGHGPWSLVRHVGRRSGRSYETPLLLARTSDGFVAELTYGPAVDWYRNIAAAGGCTVVHRGRSYTVDGVDGAAPTTVSRRSAECRASCCGCFVAASSGSCASGSRDPAGRGDEPRPGRAGPCPTGASG